MPQCAVIGWPIHTGHVSPAALSQTVKMKSNCGASGTANSSQLFERMPAVSNPSPFKTESAIGWTSPLGWLPALHARNRPSPSLFLLASPKLERALVPVHNQGPFEGLRGTSVERN